MAIVVEDGTGKSDAVSYVTVAYADAYHLARGNTSWTGADEVKEAALIRATDYLDGKYSTRWPGTRESTTQALDWPRVNAYDVDNYILSDVPEGVKKSICEAALVELVDAGALSEEQDRGGQVAREVVGPIETEYFAGAPASTVYPAIARCLSRILGPTGLRMVRV